MSVGCYDCGLPYDDEGFQDLVVPNDVWLKISPTGHEGGLLCPSCMCRRAHAAGVECAARFTSGPFREKLVLGPWIVVTWGWFVLGVLAAAGWALRAAMTP